jgi:CHAT domain-containing protein/tetratricopeptide (TPR) repeat protein
MFWRSDRKLKSARAIAIWGLSASCCFYFVRQLSAATREAASYPQQFFLFNQQSGSNSPFADEIAEAKRLYHAGNTAEAEKHFSELLQKAKQASDSLAVAEAHLGLGTVAYRLANYDTARSECERALSLFDSSHSALGVAQAHEYLGNIAFQLADNKTAKNHYNEALKEFEAAGMLRERAELLVTLAYVTDGYPERIKLDTEALELGRQVGDRRIQGQALHGIGQWLFVQGDARTAEQKYKEAETLLDSPDDKMQLARVLLSEGRLQRAHGEMDRAIELYSRGLKMSEETQDTQGRVQIMNAMAVAYAEQKKFRDALVMFQRTLELAKATKAAANIEMLQQNIAENYVDLGEYQRGVDILEEMNSRKPDPFPYAQQFRYATLANAYERLGEYDRALTAATKSVEEARAHKNEQLLSEPLMLKAHAEEKLGQNEAALNDVQDALKVIEGLRARLVPADFMKRGFADRMQAAFAYSVQLHQDMHQPVRALEVAEQARSRAFLDLLATRGIQSVASQNSPAIASTTSAMAAGKDKNTIVAQNLPSDALTTRGEVKHDQPSSKETEAASNLPSPVSATAPTIEQMVAVAKRLDSTILSYWVLPDATYIWTLKPDGTVRSVRTVISAERLSQLVAATMSPDDEKPPAANPQTSSQTSSAAMKGPEKKQGTMRLRGGGDVIVSDAPKDAWRELYRLLILPVQESMPARGTHMTIVPHGPLFRLSFAALQDAQGRYLVENYALNYAPSLGVLRLTGERKQRLGQREPHYLIIADPLTAPDLSTETELPPLPGARQEARSLVRLLPRGETTVLMGSEASKESLREQLAGKTVLHLATHAIVRDDQPLDSFLALSASRNSPPGDGHLTMQEIYGMDLQTDLVVLSACSTARGKLSGDGMVGLTRAFFYGGAPSVMATMWDVADEPTSQLMANFYSSLQKDHDKSRALQTAQLQLMRALRAGSVHVKTSVGPVTLPEDPAFWAGFVLQGEP